ncbi:hypothetical protein E2C01_070088 [Portunus trituberculatus]|uniref:Uncharacterized protein n=1 Tax=Portunus trituberculatus TaxID=210409 RepID=A0A5B7I0M7_PORTR|nr:hypothetical protein [Portunus trituberculatus]
MRDWADLQDSTTGLHKGLCVPAAFWTFACKTVTHIILDRDDPGDLAGRPAPLSPAPLSSRPIPAAGRKVGNSTSLTAGVAHLGAEPLSRSLPARIVLV